MNVKEIVSSILSATRSDAKASNVASLTVAGITALIELGMQSAELKVASGTVSRELSSDLRSRFSARIVAEAAALAKDDTLIVSPDAVTLKNALGKVRVYVSRAKDALSPEVEAVEVDEMAAWAKRTAKLGNTPERITFMLGVLASLGSTAPASV